MKELLNQYLKDKKVRYGAIGIGVFLCIILGIGIYTNIEIGKNRIHPGVSVEGISLGKYSLKDGEKKIKEEITERLKNEKIRLKTDVTSYSYSWEELGFFYPTKDLAKMAYDVGRSSSTLQNHWDIFTAAVFGKDIQGKISVGKDILDRQVQALAEKIYVEPVDAQFSYEDETISVSKERAGTSLDINKSKTLLMGLEPGEESTVVDLPIQKTNPKYKQEDFAKINGVLGTFETNYKSSEKNRKHNIELGSEFLDHLLVNPGQVVSFNQTIGDISSASGFKSAGVILNGEFDRGVGGGICQVSTTLYNALLLADVEVTERYNHSRPINYVPKGTDAAVASGYKDLKFKNNFDTPIYITSHANGSKLSFTIFGDTQHRDYQIEIVPKLVGTTAPQVIKKTSSTLSPGDQKVEKGGSTGYFYKTYKKVIKNGEVISSEQISESHYPAQTRVVYLGPSKQESSEKSSSEKKETSSSKST